MDTPKNSFQVAEVQIHYTRPQKGTRPKITSPKDAADLFCQEFPEGQIDLKEFFYVMLLSRCNEVLGIAQTSIGSANGTVVNLKEIFQLVLTSNAEALILCHNHPSGALKPSDQDYNLTRKVKQFAKMIDCNLFDHIILTTEGYSFPIKESFKLSFLFSGTFT